MIRRWGPCLAVGAILVTVLTACSLVRTPGAPAPEAPSPAPASATPPVVTTPTDLPFPTAAEPPTSTPAFPTPASAPISHLPSGTDLRLEWIEMATLKEGWAVGGVAGRELHFLRTTDGGLHWKDITPPDTDELAEGARRGATAASRDAQHAWILYSGVMDLQRGPIAVVVWRTADGGQSWQPSRVIEAPGGSGWFEPLALGFLDDGFGWLMAAIDAGMNHQYIAVYTTTDDGASWVRVVDPYGQQPVHSCPKTGLVFIDHQTGWMTRDCAGLMDQVTVIITTDGGVTWTETSLPAIPSLPGGFTYANLCTPHGIRLDSPSAGSLLVSCRQYLETPTAAGDFVHDGPHALYRTADGGATWSIAEIPAGSLYWLDPQRGWSLGRTIFWTEDGGASWMQRHQVSWDGQFSFVDAMNGWAVATNEDETALVQTTSGGTKWSILKPVIGP